MRVAEVNGQSGVDPQLGVLGHLGALVPGERAAQLAWEGADGGGYGIPDGFSAVTRQGGAVLDPGLVTVAVHRREVQEHGEPGRPLDQGADGGAVEPDDEVALPVAGHGPVFGLRRPLADHDLGSDKLLAPSRGPCPGDTQRPAGAQAGHQLTAQGASALDEQRLVDGLVRDPHGLIIREIGPQAGRRSAPGSTTLPNDGPDAARAGDR